MQRKKIKRYVLPLTLKPADRAALDLLAMAMGCGRCAAIRLLIKQAAQELVTKSEEGARVGTP